MTNSFEINVALVVDSTEAEGPGNRFAVWVQGCPMRCAGCCNPEFLAFQTKQLISVEQLLSRALCSDVEGVSFLGGEPFSQAEGLFYFAKKARENNLSVMVFSGYTLKEIQTLSDPFAAALLSETDLLVDGRYNQKQRTTKKRWIGSDNQVLHFLSDRYDPEDSRFFAENHLEIRLSSQGTITINGYPILGANTGFSSENIFDDADDGI